MHRFIFPLVALVLLAYSPRDAGAASIRIIDATAPGSRVDFCATALRTRSGASASSSTS